MKPAQFCVESQAPKQEPKPPLYTGTVRKESLELSVEHLTRYDWPEGSLKTESHAGLEPGMGEALAEVVKLIVELLSPVLETFELVDVIEEIPELVEDVDDGAVVIEEVLLAEVNELVEPGKVGESVDDDDERLVDAETELVDRVVEAETELEEEASSSGSEVLVGCSPS